MKSHYVEYLQEAQRSYFIAVQKKKKKKHSKEEEAAVFLHSTQRASYDPFLL